MINILQKIFGKNKTRQEPVKVVKYGYDAARVSRWTNDFITELGTINREIKSDMRAVRVRARSLWKNSSIVRAYRKRLISDVVGRDGFKLQMRIKDASGEVDKDANQKLEAAWDDWSKEEFCTMKGDRNLTQVCYQYIESRKRDGEFICRLIEDSTVNKFGFSLELIEPDLLDDQLNMVLPNGNVIIMGIEVDKWKRPVNYYFKKNTIKDELQGTYSYFDVMGSHLPIPAEDILHRFNPEHSNQFRGISELAPVMIDLHNLKGYDEAAIIASRVGASATMVIETETGDETTGDEKDSEGNQIHNLSYGEVSYLNPGEKLSSWTPDYPRGEYPEFTRACYKRIAVALGLNYNSLLSDLENVNFSSMRSGLLMERDQWFVDQSEIINSLLIPVFGRWLKNALFNSLLNDNKPIDLPYRPDDYNKPEFFGRTFAWVDPYKDVQATVVALNNNLTTVTRELKKQGRDFDDMLEERKDEVKKMKAAGVMPDGKIKVGVEEGGGKGEEEDDDEGKNKNILIKELFEVNNNGNGNSNG